MHEGITQAEYIEHRGIKETEAESVAYIVAGTLGLDTRAYSVGYVAQWSQADTTSLKNRRTCLENRPPNHRRDHRKAPAVTHNRKRLAHLCTCAQVSKSLINTRKSQAKESSPP